MRLRAWLSYRQGGTLECPMGFDLVSGSASKKRPGRAFITQFPNAIRLWVRTLTPRCGRLRKWRDRLSEEPADYNVALRKTTSLSSRYHQRAENGSTAEPPSAGPHSNVLCGQLWATISS